MTLCVTSVHLEAGPRKKHTKFSLLYIDNVTFCISSVVLTVKFNSRVVNHDPMSLLALFGSKISHLDEFM